MEWNKMEWMYFFFIITATSSVNIMFLNVKFKWESEVLPLPHVVMSLDTGDWTVRGIWDGKGYDMACFKFKCEQR